MTEGAAPRPDAPIGVFDSGVGGLTVLAALRARLPGECFLYLGDTARLPYGTKSGETVARYALQATDVLVARGVKALVVACNTASSVALPAITARHPGLPVTGVVEPGAQAACEATRRGHVAVLATEGTIRGGAYQRAIARLRPETRVEGVACPMFVALAEEGWNEGSIAEAVARRYLDPLFGATGGSPPPPDVLVLGCTHFPLLLAPIRAAIGAGVRIVDSAATTAATVEDQLTRDGMLASRGTAPGSRFLATDGRDRFARVGSAFLGVQIDPADVELVDLPAPPAAPAGEARPQAGRA
ncbi:MAG: glutamate racemase [Steroidobacteraceae bacterium]|nr:glutamate racemase [Steroidobacteraceae bacterium]